MGKSIQNLFFVVSFLATGFQAQADILTNPNQNQQNYWQNWQQQNPWNTQYNQAWNSYQQYQTNTGMPANGAYVPGGPYLEDGQPNPQYAKPWELSNPFQQNYYSGPGSPGFGFHATAPLMGYTGPGPGSMGVYSPGIYAGVGYGAPCGRTVGGCGSGAGRCFTGRCGGGYSSGYSSDGSGSSYSLSAYRGSFDRDYYSSRSTASSSDSGGTGGGGNTPSKDACKEKIEKGVVEKLGADFINKAFNLATYRLAVKTLQTKGVVDLVAKDADIAFSLKFLEDKVKDIAKDPEYKTKLPSLLAEYRKSKSDQEEIQKKLAKSINANKKLECLPNNILAESIILSQGDATSEADASAVWAVEKIRGSDSAGSDAGKKFSILWRVDRILNGTVKLKGADGKEYSLGTANGPKTRAAEIKKVQDTIDSEQASFDKSLSDALAAIKADPGLLKCMAKKESCPSCGEASLKTQDLTAENKAIILRVLSQYSGKFTIQDLGESKPGNKKVCDDPK